jgi:pre-rRNA-processing protein TSR2
MTTSGPSLEDQALLLFARSTIDLLHIWPALRLAITHGWGGGTKQSNQGRTHLAEDIVDLFYSSAQTTSSNSTGSSSLSEGGVNLPAQDEVEETLKWSISQQFDLDLEDGSEIQVSKDLISLWRECIRRVINGQSEQEGELAKKFREGAEKAKREDGQGRFQAQRGPGQDGEEDQGDTTDEDDDSDGFETEEDAEMGDGTAQAPPAPRERIEPVVDEDGFEMVQPKKKGGKR